jgi:uncharacterized damage-inducible protein DinB
MKKAVLIFVLITPLLSFGSAEPVEVKAQLIADWERAKAYTKEYLDAMPEEGISFKPSAEMRTFAEHMLHLAQGSIGLSSNATAKERLYANINLEKQDQYKSKEALAKIVLESYDFVIEGIRTMDETKWDEVVKRGAFEVTRLGWLMKAFEHQTHHRGQCTVYLRLKNITPPNEKLF